MVPIHGVALIEALDTAPSELEQAIGVLRSTGWDPLDLTVAAGDRILVALAEEATAGPIEITAGCPACEAVNSIELNVASLPEHRPRSRWLGQRRGVREPTYQDLQDLPADEATAVAMLATRCASPGVPVDDAIEALELIDGSLAGPVAAACVECAHELSIDADVQHLALRRLRLWAETLERDTHLLASRYGWSLADIEALPEPRRRRLAALAEAGS